MLNELHHCFQWLHHMVQKFATWKSAPKKKSYSASSFELFRMGKVRIIPLFTVQLLSPASLISQWAYSGSQFLRIELSTISTLWQTIGSVSLFRIASTEWSDNISKFATLSSGDNISSDISVIVSLNLLRSTNKAIKTVNTTKAGISALLDCFWCEIIKSRCLPNSCWPRFYFTLTFCNHNQHI